MTREMYRQRLEEVLGSEEEPMHTSLEPLNIDEVAPVALESATCVALVPDTDGKAPGLNPTLRGGDTAPTAQVPESSSKGGQLERAAEEIANTLMGTFGRAIQDVHSQVTADRTKLDGASETMIRLSAEIRQVNTEVSTLSPKVEELAVEHSTLGSRLTALEGRLSHEEQGSTQMQERLDKLVTAQEEATQKVEVCIGRLSDLDARMLQFCEQVGSLEAGLQSQIAIAARLSSLCEKLDQFQQSLARRVDSQEEIIPLIRNEVRQPAGMLERVLGTLRALDLRRESRFPVDEAATVTVSGDPEQVIAARLVDASASGLGLLLEKDLQGVSEIRVEVNGTTFRGKVAYCLPRGEKYAVGLKLAEPLLGRHQGSNPVV